MQNYDFLLNAAQPVALMQAAGVNVYYKTGVEAAGLTGVRVKGEGGGLDIVLLPGEGIRLPTEQSRFTLTRADAGAADVAGTMLIGNAEFSASRVQGDVSILNGAGLAAEIRKADALDEQSGDQFAQRGYNYGPGSTTSYAGMRLRNPAGSGKLVIVRRVMMWRKEVAGSGRFGWLYVRAGDADLGIIMTPAQLLHDGSTPAAIISTSDSATFATVGGVGFSIGTIPGQSGLYVLDVPQLLRPGQTLSLGYDIVGSVTDQFQTRIDWLERANL